MFIGLPPAGWTHLAGLVHPHVPLDQPTHLALRVAALDHPLDKVGVLLFGLGILLLPKLITGNRSSTCENIRRSMTSRSFS